MRYAKALLAALGAAAAAIVSGLESPGFSTAEIVTTIAAFVITGGATLGVPNAGFLDLSALTPAQRAELDRFLNLT